MATAVSAQDAASYPCASYGGLAFLGADRASGRAFFLTVIAPPPYGYGADLSLRHSVVGTEVDAFSVATTPGLHLSTSPIVVSGEAGRHTLYEQTQGDCAIASATQDNALIELPITGGGGGDGGGGDGGGGDGGDGGDGDGGDGGGGDGDGDGDGDGGDGDGDGGDNTGSGRRTGSEQALLGTTASPAFLTPYSISDRLVDWGFSDEVDRPRQGRTWAQIDGMSFDDDRASRSGDGHWAMTTLGLDILTDATSRAGIAVGRETGRAGAFGGATRAEFTGAAIGPYLAYRAAPDLVLDLWLGYARRDVETRILDMTAQYDVSRLFLSANATGKWRRDGWEGLGKLSLFVARDELEAHSYLSPSGELAVAGRSEDTALLSLSSELRHPLRPNRNGTVVTPSAHLGVNLWLQRPEDGVIYDGQLVSAETDDILLDAGVGLSMAFAAGGRFDMTLDYSGTGDGLDAISGQVAYRVNF